MHNDPDPNPKQRAARTDWVRAAVLGQLASLLLATVGACSKSLSRQVRAMTGAIWTYAPEDTLHDFTCRSIMPYRPSCHSMTVDM